MSEYADYIVYEDVATEVKHEEEQKQLALAKRRILTAAGALTGLIGDPLEFLLAIIEWGEANSFEEDASFLRRRSYEPQLRNKLSSRRGGMSK